MNQLEIIAEVSQGYEGKESLAKKFISSAIIAKADAIKFQLIYANELSTKDYIHYKFFKKLELDIKFWKSLKKISQIRKIKFYLDIFGYKSLKIAEKVGADGIKIHPTDLNNYRLLREIKKSKIKKIFLGIGGSYASEICKAIKILKGKNIVIMIGFQSYPTPNNTIQIQRIYQIKKLLKNIKVLYGYADHSVDTNSLIPCSVAVGSGVNYIEKHLTLNTKKKLEDSESAILSNDFKILKENLLKAYDSFKIKNNKKNKFYMSREEEKYRSTVRKCYVSNKKIKMGHKFKNDKFLTLKRVGTNKGIYSFKIIKNKSLKINLNRDQAIIKSMLI